MSRSQNLPVTTGAQLRVCCEVIGGDVFTAVPADYDTYLLSRVIHDWNDERAIAILTRCFQAMQPQGKVLLLERVIQTGGTPDLLVL